MFFPVCVCVCVQAQESPAVGLPEPNHFWTLTLTSPGEAVQLSTACMLPYLCVWPLPLCVFCSSDNSLAGKGRELVHWMV